MALSPAGLVFAEAPQFCAVFCGARDQMQDTALTPIRQLDGDALFQSAAAMREQVMSSEQRRLNQFWLHDTAATRLHGGRVWSRLLRYSVKRYNTQRFANQGSRTTKPDAAQEDKFEYGSFAQDKGEYHLHLSDDNIRFVVQYSF